MIKRILIYAFAGALGVALFSPVISLTETEQVSMSEFRALQREVADIKRRIGLVYTSSGEVFQEGETGITDGQFHEVKGTSKLVAGVDTVTLNDGPSGNLADVTFISDSSYYGTVAPVNTGISNHYKIVPISKNKFCVESSDATDTATVRWRVEGE